MKKQSAPSVHIGISSLLLIFLVLCLVSFAVLSLSNATADLTLSRRYAARTEQYYRACVSAQDFLADTDRALHDLKEATPEEATFLEAASRITLTKTFPVTDTQTLVVRLRALPFEEAATAGRSFAVDTWNIVTDEAAYPLDESLPVMP